MSKESAPVGVRRLGRVLYITLSRPALKNAINEDMVTTLYRNLREAAQDDSVGAVVLEGSGDAFCAGADIKNLALGAEHTRKYSTEVLLRVGAEAAMLLHEMPKPTIAMIRGPAMGGGLSLALACDFRLADSTASLSYAHTKIALSGDFAAAYFLSKWMGAGKAREFCLLNPVYGAQEAFTSGLLSKVCEDSELEADVERLATRLAEGPTNALACIKANLKNAQEMSCESYIAEEIKNFQRCRNSDEHREALKAFIEKREPNFPRQQVRG
ncbi:enoyl-CoA hydratase-related protein [Zhongshania sp.]|uniref:enoyl-CoA hydratase-related protein n=1 Tax=Zhongshania sp. TaxID=1971902 RepID=UPI002A8095AC|nr:enoyl-CoA hydratase-related protein [Zhongshania sp.]